MRDRQHVIHEPVQHEAGREEGKECGEHDGHELHDLGLYRVQGCGVQLLLTPHADAHQQRQDEVGVFLGEVVYPQDEGRLAHLNALEQYPVQGDEYRNLNKDRQTAA